MNDGGTPAPTGAGRIDSLDVLRGVAILGILLMNIIGFGLPDAYENPANYGGHTGADFAAWLTTTMLFEGTMRGLFTLLFGAGVVLFTSRLERQGVPDVADLHVRRMLWLVAFGFFNSHVLLWHGDILFEYGVVGLVIYAFRKSQPRTLLLIAAACLLWITGRGVLEMRGMEAERVAATAPAASEEAIDAWKETLGELQPSAEDLDESIATMRGPWLGVYEHATGFIKWWRTSFFYRYGFLEDFATMLIGIALFSLGALQGRWPTRRYVWLAVGGYGFGLTVNAIETMAMLRSGFDPLVVQWTWLGSYEFGRVPVTLGHVGLIMIIWKSGFVPAAMRRLAAVGRMALTNYLTQSLICTLLFTGVGFGWFGQLARHELYYVVAAVWTLQLIWSPFWLARFQYGPAEWLWRSLTYRKRQPMRGTAGTAAGASA